MSTRPKELLLKLNGNKEGKLKQFLDRSKHLNIAWYPSAGADFRGLFYLSKTYSKLNPASQKETVFPDIFLFTDYLSATLFDFSADSVIHEDETTHVTIKYIEELPELTLPLDSEIVDFPEQKQLLGKVFYMEVSLQSDYPEEFVYPVIYVVTENESFCSEVLLPNKTELSHIIHIRYGGGFGGGKAAGSWILNVLEKLHCQVFITDNHHTEQEGDRAAVRLYPNLAGQIPNMKVIRKISTEKWSHHGDITWNKI